MARTKSIDRKDANGPAIPGLTPWTFVRAAGLANLLVAAFVFLEFSVIALAQHDGRAFRMGLWLVPFVSLVIWGTAAVLGAVALAPRRLLALGRRLIGRAESPPSGSPGIWDEWLDGARPHDS
jgi:hypothetical protein